MRYTRKSHMKNYHWGWGAWLQISLANRQIEGTMILCY